MPRSIPVGGARQASGFTLMELMIVVAISIIVMAAAVPQVIEARRRMELNGAAHDVMSAVQSARLKAVSTGRTMRIRFNCPAANQYRIIEVTGDPLVDGAADRCDEAAYPYPDLNPGARPNLDGPLQRLRGGVTFTAVVNLDLAPSGRVTAAAMAMPVTLTVSKTNATRNITVSNNGRAVLQ